MININFLGGGGQASPGGGCFGCNGGGGFPGMGGLAGSDPTSITNQMMMLGQQTMMMSMMSMMKSMMDMLLMEQMFQMLRSSPGFGGGSGGGGNPGVGNFLGGGGGGGGGGGSPVGGASQAGGATSSGPPGPGVQGALDKARSMLGLQEGRDRARIQEVTGKSGINPATTPWCAAFAMNILKDAGVLNLDGLSNRNYCPTIVSWAKEKGIWGQRGAYQPKPGDAIMFDWQGDGTSDHIGIVEKVENGKVITIEGNSSDSVKRNTYELGSSKIMGYVIGGKPHGR